MFIAQLHPKQTTGAPSLAERGTMGQVPREAMPEPDLDSLSSALPPGPGQGADWCLMPLRPPRLTGVPPSFVLGKGK